MAGFWDALMDAYRNAPQQPMPLFASTPQEKTLDQTYPGAPAMVGAIAEPFKQFTQAHYSEFQPGRSVQDMPQTMQHLPEVAMNMMGGGVSFAQPASAGIFGGRLAKTADQAALARAEDLAAKGAPKEQIWNDTGWFTGADGKWRFEIPDDQAKMTWRSWFSDRAKLNTENPALAKKVDYYDSMLIDSMTPRKQANKDRVAQEAGLLKDYNSVPAAISHPDLLAAYPDVASVSMNRSPGTSAMIGYNGLFNSGNGAKDSIVIASDAAKSKSTPLHELQHYVQEHEGFASGGDPAQIARGYRSIIRDAEEQIATINSRLAGAAGTPKYDELLSLRQELVNEIQRIQGPHMIGPQEKAFDEYQRLAGEVESRNVQKRMDMTPEQRRAAPPWTTQDFPFNQQIVK